MRRVTRQPGPTRRQASIVVCVLACMLVATALVVSATKAALQTRREVRTQHQLRQVELVLEAGIQRAARQLQDNTDYRGEIWKPSPAATSDLAQVKIEVSSDEVHVVASVPAGLPVTIQRSYSFPIKNHAISNEE